MYEMTEFLSNYVKESSVDSSSVLADAIRGKRASQMLAPGFQTLLEAKSV